jgi:hypothetical protein
MNPETAKTRDTSAAPTPPTSAEPADHQVEQTEVRKLVGLVAGRIVNYVMANGVVRPFLVVNAFDGEGTVNGLLFFDGINDAKIQVVHPKPEPSGALPVFAMLIASVSYSEDLLPGTWHWPQKQGVVASSVDPEALATQLMGVNENALQKTARELELRIVDMVDEKLDAHLKAANELLDGFKQLLEDLSADTAKRAAQSVATIERPTEFASLDEATKACGKDEVVHVAEDGKITIVNPSEEAKAAAAGSQASDASTQGTSETERKAPEADSSQTGS